MGTPEFAVASLDAIVKAGHEVIAVVTAADKPAGRGQKLTGSAVKQYAESAGLLVLQPEKLRDPQFIDALRQLNADLQVVVAFRMLPEVVWSMPRLGTINLHASLLPQYRGAAPINWAVINGEQETGVTTFFIQKEIDTGNLLLSEKVPIGNDETAGELHDKLMITGAHLLVRTLELIGNGSYSDEPQEESGELKTAPKLFKENGLIDWHRPCREVYNKIRGLSPYPAAYTVFQGKTLRIFRAELLENEPAAAAGEFVTDYKTYLKFACDDGLIGIIELQLEGKKRMDVREFLRGMRLS